MITGIGKRNDTYLAASRLQRMPAPPPPAVQTPTADERVAKLCEAIGYGPGDVALARYIVGLEDRIAELEKQLGRRNTAQDFRGDAKCQTL